MNATMESATQEELLVEIGAQRKKIAVLSTLIARIQTAYGDTLGAEVKADIKKALGI